MITTLQNHYVASLQQVNGVYIVLFIQMIQGKTKENMDFNELTMSHTLNPFICLVDYIVRGAGCACNILLWKLIKIVNICITL